MQEPKRIMGVAEHAGYLILRLRYYPAWAVRVNGRPVRVQAERERGLMAVPVPQGNDLVSVDWTTTGDVVAGRWISFAALLAIAGLYWFERKQLQADSSLGGASSFAATVEYQAAQGRTGVSDSASAGRRVERDRLARSGSECACAARFAIREGLAEVEGGGDELHHGLLFEAEGGRAGGVFGVEGAVILPAQRKRQQSPDS